MRAYEEYKQIGLPWLDQIPAHWKIVRNKNVLTSEDETVGNESNKYQLLSLSLHGVIIRDVESGKGKFPKDFDSYKIVKQNRIIFCLFDMDETPRTVGLSTHYGMITGAYDVFHVSGVNEKYIYYYYIALDDVKALKPLYTGLRKVISLDKFLSTSLPLPPREEQDAIVRFLDAKCAKIDSLIKLKERQIALLNEKKQSIINQAVTRGLDPNAPMKDSGVDYIGMIPSHWRVILNHRLWEEKTRGYSTTETVLSLSQQDGVVPYEDMTERSLHTSSYDNWKLVFPGDLVVNRFKAHLGVFFSSAYRGIVTFHYGVFQFKMNGSTKYYEYLYHTPKFCRVYASLSDGMTVGLQNLSNSHFYSAYSVYPPVHEQKEIVDKIETINVIYRNKIKIIENEILILHEYKMKLISDVVTGKINIL